MGYGLRTKNRGIASANSENKRASIGVELKGCVIDFLVGNVGRVVSAKSSQKSVGPTCRRRVGDMSARHVGDMGSVVTLFQATPSATCRHVADMLPTWGVGMRIAVSTMSRIIVFSNNNLINE